MSGGSLGYAYSKVGSIVEQLGEFSDVLPTFTEEYQAINTLLLMLGECADGLYAAEWWLSGDTGSKELIQWAARNEKV